MRQARANIAIRASTSRTPTGGRAPDATCPMATRTRRSSLVPAATAKLPSSTPRRTGAALRASVATRGTRSLRPRSLVFARSATPPKSTRRRQTVAMRTALGVTDLRRTRPRRPLHVAPATRRSKRARPPATRSARAATSRTRAHPSRKRRAVRATRPRRRGLTPWSRGAARRAIARTALAASRRPLPALRAMCANGSLRSTRFKVTPTATVVIRRTSSRARTARRAPARATPTSATISRKRPSARGVTSFGGRASPVLDDPVDVQCLAGRRDVRQVLRALCDLAAVTVGPLA